jgi:hypothetical protein
LKKRTKKLLNIGSESFVASSVRMMRAGSAPGRLAMRHVMCVCVQYLFKRTNSMRNIVMTAAMCGGLLALAAPA